MKVCREGDSSIERVYHSMAWRGMSWFAMVRRIDIDRGGEGLASVPGTASYQHEARGGALVMEYLGIWSPQWW